jgi:hypothetical protein
MMHLPKMHPDRIWTDGPVRAVIRIGIPAGLGWGLLQLLTTGSAPRALFWGVFFGVAFGGSMAWSMRGRWQRSSDLASEDRVAVARAVRRGEDIQDERLADAVVHYAGVVRQQQERDARADWVLVAVAAMTSIIAIASTAAGATRDAVVFWLLTAFWVVSLAWVIPWRRDRTITNARRAELAARSKGSWSGQG